jgi:hypothetical protein
MYSLNTRKRRRNITVATVLAALSFCTMTSALPAVAASKKVSAKKLSEKTTRPATKITTATPTPAPAAPKRVLDPNRCNHADIETVSGIVGLPLVLDTSVGDAGMNTHTVNEGFEQCIFNDAGLNDSSVRMRVVVHVQRDGKQIHEEILSGAYSSPCPAACVAVPGLGDSAVVSSKFGDGGGLTVGPWAHLHILKGSTRVYIAVAPQDINQLSELDHASQLPRMQIDQAVAIAKLALARL